MRADAEGQVLGGLAAAGAEGFGVGEALGVVVGLTGPDTRFTPETIPTLEKQLIAAARTLTLRLGGNGRLFETAGPGNEAA